MFGFVVSLISGLLTLLFGFLLGALSVTAGLVYFFLFTEYGNAIDFGDGAGVNREDFEWRRREFIRRRRRVTTVPKRSAPYYSLIHRKTRATTLPERDVEGTSAASTSASGRLNGDVYGTGPRRRPDGLGAVLAAFSETPTMEDSDASISGVDSAPNFDTGTGVSAGPLRQPNLNSDASVEDNGLVLPELTTDPAGSVVLKEGNILIVGGAFNTWKKRYARVLPGCLEVYKKQYDVKPHRVIDLRFIKIGEEADAESRHSFIVVQKQTDHVDYFRCDSMVKKEGWMRAIARANEPVSAPSARSTTMDNLNGLDDSVGASGLPTGGAAAFAPRPPQQTDLVWESAEWLNMLLPFLYEHWDQTDFIGRMEKKMANKLAAKLNAVDRPSWVGHFVLTKFDIASRPPLVDSVTSKPLNEETDMLELRTHILYPGVAEIGFTTVVFGKVPVKITLKVYSLCGELQIMLPRSLEKMVVCTFLQPPEVDVIVKTAIGNKEQIKNQPQLRDYILNKFHLTIVKQVVRPAHKNFVVPLGGRKFRVYSDREVADLKEAGNFLQKAPVDAILEVSEGALKEGPVRMIEFSEDGYETLVNRHVVIRAEELLYYDSAENRTMLGLINLRHHKAEPIERLMEDPGYPWQLVESRTGQKELHFYAADGPERNDWVTVINQQSGYLCEDGWTDFIEEQDRTVVDDSAVLIQAFVRRWQARRLFRSLLRRKELMQLMVETETVCVEDLKDIMHAYYEPLLRSRRGASPLIVSQEVIHAIFGVLPEITVVHKQLLARLQHRWEHWSAYQCVGDLFMSLVQHHGQLFRDYYEAYDRQMSTLRAVREQNPPVSEFLDQVSESGTPKFEVLLPKPLFRVEKFIILLKNMLDETTKRHDDFLLIKEAIRDLTDLDIDTTAIRAYSM